MTQSISGAQAIADSLGISISAFSAGYMRTTDEARQVFYDHFDGALDTTDRWTATSGNSGVVASNTTGVMSMGTGTVASGWSKLTSKPTFQLTIPGWMLFSDAISLPDGAAPVANSYRYIGTGTTPATPSVATPVTDGYGFELNTDGKLRAVVYAGGTRTIIADLSTSGTSKQPLDTAMHRYIILVRTDRTYFYIDGIGNANLVATTNFQSPQVQTLPKLYLTIGNTTPPASNVQIQSSGAVVGDTGKNSTAIGDGTFRWRTQGVDATGAAKVVEKRGTTGTAKTTPDSTTNATVAAANLNRIKLVLTNTSSAVAYVKEGATATATDFTHRLVQYAQAIIDDYTGQVDVVWATDPNDGALIGTETT